MADKMRWTDHYWWDEEAPVSPFAKGCLTGGLISLTLWLGAYLLWRCAS